MKPALLKEIRAACEAAADPARAAKYTRFFTEGYDAFGINWKDPEWARQRERWLEANRARGLPWFLELGQSLVRTGKYEEASIAIIFAAQMREQYTPEAFVQIGRWFEGGIRNWGNTDVLCGEVLGHFISSGIVDLEALAPWRASPWKFQRRAVPVMLLAVVDQVERIPALLEAVRPLMMDAERVVQQGVGWFLREAWKHAPKPVEKLLLEYKDTAPRLIYQYATEKMNAAQKARFRAAPRGRSRSTASGR